MYCFSNRDFFHGHRQLAGQQEKEGDHILFSLSLPSTHKHSFSVNSNVLDDLALSRSYCNNLSQTSGGFELASTITIVLNANQQSKCTSQRIVKLCWLISVGIL